MVRRRRGPLALHPPVRTASVVDQRLADLRNDLEAARLRNIGFPGAVDFDYTALAPFLTRELLNNVGDPYVDGIGRNHTKQFEREVVEMLADVFRAPADDRWGYVTSGGTEGNFWALRLAQRAFPGRPRPVVYFNERAHYSIPKIVRDLGLDAVSIRADRFDQIDYDDLHDQVGRRRDRPVVVAATIGTTMSEAVDDVRVIGRVLDRLDVRERFIHADAALAGLPLGLLEPNERPGFDFADGADTVSISGHKFPGSPSPSGVVIARRSLCERYARAVSYTGSPDTTVAGSRSGHAALILWYALHQHGVAGHRRRAREARELAAYTHAQLAQLGWPAFRYPLAFTVMLRTPPAQVLDRGWVLASSDDGWCHLMTMPGVTIGVIQDFLADMSAAIADLRRPAPLSYSAGGHAAVTA